MSFQSFMSHIEFMKFCQNHWSLLWRDETNKTLETAKRPACPLLGGWVGKQILNFKWFLQAMWLHLTALHLSAVSYNTRRIQPLKRVFFSTFDCALVTLKRPDKNSTDTLSWSKWIYNYIRQYCALLDLITHAYNMWQSRPLLKAFFISTRFYPSGPKSQCWGSESVSIGSVSFWASRIRIRIRWSQVLRTPDLSIIKQNL
jgi:hypothetical protein